MEKTEKDGIEELHELVKKYAENDLLKKDRDIVLILAATREENGLADTSNFIHGSQQNIFCALMALCHESESFRAIVEMVNKGLKLMDNPLMTSLLMAKSQMESAEVE